MQRAGLEWLFRLASAPWRLFKRYLVSNTAFIYYFLTGRL
jgi:N-acetylglucosaminyldiphosphoundecaprenol N-acetyl-beta-D-mannosaminyltransferase